MLPSQTNPHPISCSADRHISRAVYFKTCVSLSTFYCKNNWPYFFATTSSWTSSFAIAVRASLLIFGYLSFLHNQLHRKYNVWHGTIICMQSSNLKVYRLKQHIFRRFKAADRRDAFTSRHANHNWMELSRSIEFALLTCCTIQRNHRSDVINYEAPRQLPRKLLVSQQFQRYFCRFRQ